MLIPRKLIEKYLYEELQKQNKLEELKFYCQENNINLKIRQKTIIEELIENDDIDNFKILSNSNSFDFNQKIEKNNELYHYSRIPIILYCIEKNAIKCFKFALINGADPTQKSETIKISLQYPYKKEYKKVWDAYGFASSKGNLQIIRMLEERNIEASKYLIKGCIKFHQKVIFEWIKKPKNLILNQGIKEIILYENYELFDLFLQIGNLNDQSPILYAAQFNKENMAKIIVSKGANINVKDIHYQSINKLFK